MPVRKASSAVYRSLRSRLPISTSIPRSRAIVSTELCVMPSSAPALTGGVMMRPLRTTKRFSPVHSLT